MGTGTCGSHMPGKTTSHVEALVHVREGWLGQDGKANQSSNTSGDRKTL